MLIALDPMMDVSSCTLYERGEGAVQIKQVPQGIRSAEGGGGGHTPGRDAHTS